MDSSSYATINNSAPVVHKESPYRFSLSTVIITFVATAFLSGLVVSSRSMQTVETETKSSSPLGPTRLSIMCYAKCFEKCSFKEGCYEECVTDECDKTESREMPVTASTNFESLADGGDEMKMQDETTIQGTDDLYKAYVRQLVCLDERCPLRRDPGIRSVRWLTSCMVDNCAIESRPASFCLKASRYNPGRMKECIVRSIFHEARKASQIEESQV